MEKFGSYLRAQREKKGIRLEEIASITKIHIHALQQLEASGWKNLPPEPFIRGFIIAYAKYVGLDPKEVIQKYSEEINGVVAKPPGEEVPASQKEEGKPSPSKPEPFTSRSGSPTEIMEHDRTFPTRKVITAASVAAIAALLVIIIYVGKRSSYKASHPNEVAARDRGTENGVRASEKNNLPLVTLPALLPGSVENRSPASPEEKQPKDILAAAAQQKETKAEKVVQNENNHELVIEGKERTWLKVVVDDAPPVEYFLSEGQKTTYSAKNKIKLVLGNSTGSKVFHNGEVAGGTKYQGTIRSYIFPPEAKFPQDVASKRATSSTGSDPKPADEAKTEPSSDNDD